MNQLTTQELEAIRKRAEQATEGAWEMDITDDGNTMEFSVTFDVDNYAAIMCDSVLDSLATADFIANARTDIPKLLAEVDRLNDKVAYYLDEMERRQKLYDDLTRKQAINGGD